MNEYDGVRLLRTALIETAIDDYKELTLGHGMPGASCNIREIEAFFNSGWCAMLLVGMDITGPEILEQLHEWAKKQKGHKIERRGRKKSRI